MRLFIAAPDIFPADAVGNHCLGIARAARRLGWEANCYAQRFAGDVQSIDALFDDANPLIGPDDTLLVSYSIHDPLLERLLALPGRKLCYFHGVTSPELLHEFEPVTADLCAKSIEQYPQLANFERVMANSRVTAQSLAHVVPVDKIEIVPPVCPDMPIFTRALMSERRERDAAPDGLRLLTVGRVVPHKRVEDAIEIVAGVRKLGVAARLRIVGSTPNGAYAHFLLEHAKALGVGEHVDLVGVLDDDTLFAEFNAADALLTVSQHEGFCVPVLEAMRIGLPCLVRTGTAASEVAAGCAVEFSALDEAAQALHSMVQDGTLATRFEAAGKHRAAELLAQTSDAELAKRLDAAS
ncbi:glycosyltransferase family 4 protein [Paraburkholderia tropica]|uniref:glycosyltransferase family 4 protein n=1 Tax=Paraburkholderia tropica TaxID=92647 RepID=UPI002AB738F6|nr:glycosyltransferase [Paraburkholderia tropica]